MRKSIVSMVAIGLVSGLSLASAKTFHGEIMDSQCAQQGSHAMMMKQEGMGDKDPNDPMAKKMCTENCIKMGGKYVLYDSATKKVYQLDDQSKPKEFAGQAVSVNGSLDTASDTIHVSNIKAANK